MNELLKNKNYLKKKILGLFLLGFVFCCTADTHAFDIPENSGTRVLDETGTLSTQNLQNLTEQIAGIEAKTTAQIAVYMISSTQGADIGSLAVEVGRKWEIGEQNNNGLLLLIALEDREWFIATGYRTEAVLTDIQTKQIGEKNFPTHFRSGDYFTGLSRALFDIERALNQDLDWINYSDTHTKSIEDDLVMLLFVSFLAFHLGGILSGLNKKYTQRASLIQGLIFSLILFFVFPIALWIISSVLSSVLFFLGHLTGKHARKMKSSTQSGWGGTSSWRRSSGGRGGGFGGGSFGGGGSRGRW
jgi:uncharacterized protein